LKCLCPAMGYERMIRCQAPSSKPLT
jgi:hypothetical protein